MEKTRIAIREVDGAAYCLTSSLGRGGWVLSNMLSSKYHKPGLLEIWKT